jgi:putative hydrolase of the HAD superfamily
MAERSEPAFGIFKAAAGGIGGGEISDVQPGGEAVAVGKCQVRIFSVPAGSLGKGDHCLPSAVDFPEPVPCPIALGQNRSRHPFSPYTDAGEVSELGLRAVVFDYGMVLSSAPDAVAKAHLARITGLEASALESLYWIDRHAYDRGDLTGLEFWRKLGEDAGLTLTTEQVAELNQWDARMWTTENKETLAWQRVLKERGFETAILSNMGDNVLENMEREFGWIGDFDVCVWSYRHRLAKPEAAIYKLLLEKLGTAPEETLFLDDKLENVEAARHMGIRALQFSTVEQLRQDLITTRLDEWLPLP